MVDLIFSHFAGVTAVTQDGDMVGDLADFTETMGDIYYGDTLRF